MLRMAVFGLLVSLAGPVLGQSPCINGSCQVTLRPSAQSVPSNTINIAVLGEDLGQDLRSSESFEPSAAGGGAQFEQVIRATVRVTVSGVCGSGTIVGKDRSGRALVLTNAHVAGTSKGRTVNVERWNINGQSEKSTATIIASGYGKGMSIDFAILRAADGFGSDVKPVPIANRQPDTSKLITTYGCPRCEWPSLQVLKLNRSEGQILRWHPEAIGGRSGSSVVDYTDNGPEVVGLLTWGGGGEGLGQSMPFVLNALQGRLPASLEALPPYAKEVSTSESTSDIRYVRASWPDQEVEAVDEDLVDAITGGRLRPNKPKEPNDDPGKGLLRPRPEPPVTGLFTSLFRGVVVFIGGLGVGLISGYVLRGRISQWIS